MFPSFLSYRLIAMTGQIILRSFEDSSILKMCWTTTTAATTAATPAATAADPSKVLKITFLVDLPSR